MIIFSGKNTKEAAQAAKWLATMRDLES